MLYDVLEHMIEAHGTRTVCMRLGPEGQSVGAEFRVMNGRTPTLSMRKLVKQGYRFEAGPTGCKVPKGHRSVTLDDVKKTLWANAKATIEGARNNDARLVAPVVDGLPEEPPSGSGPDHTKPRDSSRTSWVIT